MDWVPFFSGMGWLFNEMMGWWYILLGFGLGV